jgi:formylglycine-generating enzyme required for sulfatase activity
LPGHQDDPQGAPRGTDRVIRGGYHKNTADLFRGSCRLHQGPDVGRDGIGFRCAYDDERR